MLSSQVIRFGEALRRLFGGKGHFGLSVLDDVMPVHSILDPSPESFFLRATFAFTARVTSGTLAGQNAMVRCGASPGHIVVVNSVRVFKPTAGAVQVFLAPQGVPAATASPATSIRDSRAIDPGGVAATPGLLLDSTTTGIGSNLAFVATVAAGQETEVIRDSELAFIIANPSPLLVGLCVSNTTVAEAITACVSGYAWARASEE